MDVVLRLGCKEVDKEKEKKIGLWIGGVPFLFS